MEYVWRSKQQLPERFGEPCLMVSFGRAMGNKIIVKFADGQRVVTSRFSIKRAESSRR